jgi:hypothetical protein
MCNSFHLSIQFGHQWLTAVSSLTSLIAAAHMSSPWRIESSSVVFYIGQHTQQCYIYDGKIKTITSSTTPVGNFHTPVPRNRPLFSWTTSTWEWNLQLCFEKTTFRETLPPNTVSTILYSFQMSKQIIISQLSWHQNLDFKS